MIKRLSIVTSLAFLTLFSALSNAAPVNVNKASAQEIAASLNGIGPAKAEAIADFCQKSKCSKPNDLLAIKGIGEKTLTKIAEDLRF